MKISVAQTRPVKGNIQKNMEGHLKLINKAVSSRSDLIIFPELSLTGYEPTLSKELATHPNDNRFDEFQRMADANGILIGAGIPTENTTGICISMILFQPNRARQVYSKKYLHPDEDEFFVSGPNFTENLGDENNIALAICYELSVPEHAANAFERGAAFYIASVAKFANGIDKAFKRLSDIAHEYSMTVFMANSVGQSDGNECAGKTSIWNKDGTLVGQLDNTHEGILTIDTETQELTEMIL